MMDSSGREAEERSWWLRSRKKNPVRERGREKIRRSGKSAVHWSDRYHNIYDNQEKIVNWQNPLTKYIMAWTEYTNNVMR